MTECNYKPRNNTNDLSPLANYLADVTILFISLFSFVYKKLYTPLINAVAPYLFVASLITLLGVVGAGENGQLNTKLLIISLVLAVYSGIKGRILK